MADEIRIVFCTFPEAGIARQIARELVELRLAACASVIPQVHSVYRWQGKVDSGDEALAIFKLSALRYPDFEAKLRALHPYEVPEIIACPIDHGLPEYLDWVRANSSPDSSQS